MKSMKTPFFLFLLFLGLTITILGLFTTPELVARYVKHVETLPSYTVTKIINYQLYSVIAGCVIFLLAVYLFNNKYAKYLFLPAIVILFLLIHSVYIQRIYPNNIFLKTSELIKPWRVLLGKDIVLSDYQPKSGLKVKNRKVLKAKYPAIDFHFHFDSYKNLKADDLIKAMDACGIAKIVNIDGWPKVFEKYKMDFVDKYPDRFIMLAAVNLGEIDRPDIKPSDFPKRQIAILEKAVTSGARGLKVYKSINLQKDASGKLVPLDDSRYAPIWDKAGEMGIPVLMHSADPSAFWAPGDRFNERYEELKDYPGWSFNGPQFPKKEALLSQTENLVKRHPKTIFVMAHMGSNPENLEYVDHLMDKYPNYYVDISAVINELGRQPYTARKFFIKYQDRILFGTDGGWGLDANGLWPPERLYRTYFEFLETYNEYFEYQLWGTYSQGRWRIYGIDLPDEVLEKIYYKNAEKLLYKSKRSY